MEGKVTIPREGWGASKVFILVCFNLKWLYAEPDLSARVHWDLGDAKWKTSMQYVEVEVLCSDC